MPDQTKTLTMLGPADKNSAMDTTVRLGDGMDRELENAREIGQLRAEVTASGLDRARIWQTIAEMQKSAASIQLILFRLDTLGAQLATAADIEKRVRALEDTDVASDSKVKTLIGVATIIGSVVGGVATLIGSHLTGYLLGSK